MRLAATPTVKPTDTVTPLRSVCTPRALRSAGPAVARAKLTMKVQTTPWPRPGKPRALRGAVVRLGVVRPDQVRRVPQLHLARTYSLVIVEATSWATWHIAST